MMKIFAVLSLAALVLTGCAAAPTNNPAANNAPPTASANSAAAKTGQGEGVITKINHEIGSVELNHGEIKGMMPPMQMEFYVSDKKMLEPLKVGDKAAFTLEDDKGKEQIIKIAKSQ